jgi:RNA polymerase sigma-70 factor (ECF subfamily)
LAQAFWYPSYVFLRSSGISSLGAALSVERALGWLAAEPPALAEGLTLRETQLEATKRELGGSMKAEATSALDLVWAENHFAREPALESEALYHRRWALTVLDFTLEFLRSEYTTGPELYEALHPFLGYAASGDEAYEQLAKARGMSESGARKTVYDFRRRYRALLRAQIAETVATAEQIDSEITSLLSFL